MHVILPITKSWSRLAGAALHGVGFGVGGGGGAATAEAYIYSWETHGQNPFKCFLRDLGSPAATAPRGVAKAQSSPENPPGITPSHPGRRKASGLVCCILKNYTPY
ncbi:Hypothetical predicted protein [Podarcis lilfordi]|uniref:Uncharacterized protein n=1 Tax=Podarcis lilfordi TaxID=74358 RepID=A0AA35KRE8_9SAUR|nr:Hypothetical predicted protein [Podarcis lilfordi]